MENRWLWKATVHLSNTQTITSYSLGMPPPKVSQVVQDFAVQGFKKKATTNHQPHAIDIQREASKEDLRLSRQHGSKQPKLTKGTPVQCSGICLDLYWVVS